MNDHLYHRPRSLTEAFEFAAGDDDARFIAGGTDLMVQMKKRRVVRPRTLISLRGVSELAPIEETETGLVIGAGATLSAILAHPVVVRDYPALARSIEVLGSRQIRNVATLGGNLCNASPAADTAPPLLVYETRVRVQGIDRDPRDRTRGLFSRAGDDRPPTR